MKPKLAAFGWNSRGKAASHNRRQIFYGRFR
jgi:hypothetical protein